VYWVFTGIESDDDLHEEVITVRQMASLELKHRKRFVEVSILGVCMLLGIFLFGVRKEGEDETAHAIKTLKNWIYISILCGWFLVSVIVAISSLASSRKKGKSNNSQQEPVSNPAIRKSRQSAYTKRMNTLSPSTRHMFGADRKSDGSRGSEGRKDKKLGIGIIEEGEDDAGGIGMLNLNPGFA